MITRYFASADGPGPGSTWSVYREDYMHKNDYEPVEIELISVHDTEEQADRAAHRIMFDERMISCSSPVCLDHGIAASLAEQSERLDKAFRGVL